MSKKLEELLNSQHQWPCEFIFKFVVPAAQVGEVKALFSTDSLEERASSAGKYISLTMKKRVSSSDEVLAVYKRASSVPGLIAL